MGRDDKIMQRGYSKNYGKRRKKKGLQTKYVDLHFTGKFHKSLDFSELDAVCLKSRDDRISQVKF